MAKPQRASEIVEPNKANRQNPLRPLARGELIGFKPRHFENMAQGGKPLAPRYLGELLRQCGNKCAA